MQESDGIDPEQFRAADAAWTAKQPASTKPKVRRGGRDFQRKYVRKPWLWLDVLSKTKARGVTFLLAAHLIYEAWRHDSDQVKLANVTLRKQGLSRWSKYRAVQELRAAGLIAVDERERKSPIVTVRFWRV